MTKLEQDLKKLKQMYDSSLEAKTRAEGRLEQIMETLEREHGVSTIEEAEALLVKLTKKAEKEEKELKELVDKIHQEFEWEE